MLRLNRNKAQITIEAAATLAIITFCLLIMSKTLASSFMGKWKTQADSLGDPYDPATTTGHILYSYGSDTTTTVNGISSGDQYWTLRTDVGRSMETKSGDMIIGQ